MPGARARRFRSGDSAELLAQCVLSSVAFTSPAPRQEDIGHDFFCVLAEESGELLKAGPFFTVQVKSRKQPLCYEKDHEVDWLKTQANPLFICIADRDRLQVEMFSTWNMLNGFYSKPAKKITLVPGEENEPYKDIVTSEDASEQVIPLGGPVVRITVAEAMNRERMREIASIIREWVTLDRTNLVHRGAGMYWVVGPVGYQTNVSLEMASERISFYWHRDNLQVCERNLGRVGTALRLVMTRYEPGRISTQRHEDLDRVLQSHSDCLDPLAKALLAEYVGGPFRES